jgi:cation:H+ antiporter
MLYIQLFAGIILLIKSADFLVDGSAALAKKLGISTLVIGLTIVAFGTSAPELFVNIIASVSNNNDVVLGNIIGSNIANTLLILGAASLIMPVKMKHSTTWKEIPFSLLAVLALAVFANKSFLDGLQAADGITRGNGITLILFFIIFLFYALNMALSDKVSVKEQVQEQIGKLHPEEQEIKEHPNWKITILILGGLIGLYFGGNFTVNSAVDIATSLGISQFLISATIIAIGTSLPELVTTIIAATKQEADLAVGNVVGSNIFNILFVLGITATVSPVLISRTINTDIFFLIFISILLFVFLFLGKKHILQKWQGLIFILMYVSYITYIVLRG